MPCRNSLVRGYPESEPISESMEHLGQIAVCPPLHHSFISLGLKTFSRMPLKSDLPDLSIPENVSLWQLLQIKAAKYMDRKAFVSTKMLKLY